MLVVVAQTERKEFMLERLLRPALSVSLCRRQIDRDWFTVVQESNFNQRLKNDHALPIQSDTTIRCT